jgi:SAM-dependent methyltransferase
MTHPNFDAFLAAVRDTPPNPFYGRLEPFLSETGRALELGCGSGRGVHWWRERGWSVVALDAHRPSLDVLRATLKPEEPVEIIESTFREASWPPVHLVAAVFSLFFETDAFDEVWQKIVASLPEGGLFAGQLLGPHDDWAATTTTHTRAEVEALLSPNFEILLHEEVDRPGKTATGDTKHWHVHHLIARRT